MRIKNMALGVIVAILLLWIAVYVFRNARAGARCGQPARRAM
jgi:hypothetical protein